MVHKIADDYRQWLIDSYFSDPARRIKLSKDEVLIEQGHRNDRLYLVHSGELRGYLKNSDGSQYEFFCATKGMFAGLVSFFSRTCVSASTVIAATDCELSYITLDQKVIIGDVEASLFDQFMPIVVNNLLMRRERERQAAREKERAAQKLMRHQKLASLGQMAAGLAHELNNAVAVLERNTHWLSENLRNLLHENYAKEFDCFKVGLEKGRCLSSNETRKKARAIEKKFKVSQDEAEKLAELGLEDKDLKRLIGKAQRSSDLLHFYWDMGATLHGMQKAAKHASYVVKSVKALGVAKSSRSAGQDINETIKEALSLLEDLVQQVDLELDLQPISDIFANKGELVQVWMNIIKNGCESMLNEGIAKPALSIVSVEEGSEAVVRISDNGPGIPEDILQNIFQPNFSTKSQESVFGLGLGLAIVDRLVESYGGEISLKSKVGHTVFTVCIPIGENRG